MLQINRFNAKIKFIKSKEEGKMEFNMKKSITVFLLIVILMIIIFIISVIVKKSNDTLEPDLDLYTGYDVISFEQYLGENKRAVEVKSLITSIKTENIITNNYNSLNQSEKREEIKCYFNGELLNEDAIQNKISSEYTYKVEAEYNETGAITKIMINQERFN